MSAELTILAGALQQHSMQLNFNMAFVVNQLPLWFLVFALFLPRLAMAVAWFQGALAPFHLQGIVPALFWLLLPRILVLYLIYVDQGITLWFLVHLVAALLVWGGGGHRMSRRRRQY
jgi:hypothetical protein